MKKNIVFDVDRTMVDSYLPELLSLEEAIEKALGKKLTTDELKKLTVLPTTVFFDKLGLSQNMIKLVNKEWEICFKKYQTLCFPGIKEVIKELHSKNYVINIITSRTISEFHELDNILSDILDLFEVIVTSDVIVNPKPNKDSMDYLCNKLNCTPDDVIYLGDSLVDKEFASNCNCTFIPCCWDNKELETFENALDNPLKILDIIEKINN